MCDGHGLIYGLAESYLCVGLLQPKGDGRGWRDLLQVPNEGLRTARSFMEQIGSQPWIIYMYVDKFGTRKLMYHGVITPVRQSHYRSCARVFEEICHSANCLDLVTLKIQNSVQYMLCDVLHSTEGCTRLVMGVVYFYEYEQRKQIYEFRSIDVKS